MAMKKILLSNGENAIVDDEFYEKFAKVTWYKADGYARRTVRISKTKTYQLHMHREVMGLERGDGKYVDHINRDRLDNRKENLRICDQSQNMMNKSLRKNSKSGVKGAYWHKTKKVWISRIQAYGVSYELGSFSNAEEAHAAYCKAAKKIHGEFANNGIE